MSSLSPVPGLFVRRKLDHSFFCCISCYIKIIRVPPLVGTFWIFHIPWHSSVCIIFYSLLPVILISFGVLRSSAEYYLFLFHPWLTLCHGLCLSPVVYPCSLINTMHIFSMFWLEIMIHPGFFQLTRFLWDHPQNFLSFCICIGPFFGGMLLVLLEGPCFNPMFCVYLFRHFDWSVTGIIYVKPYSTTCLCSFSGSSNV